MAIKGASNYIIVTVDEVDISNRIVHCKDRTQSNIQCSFRDAPGGIFYIPNQGERWLARKIGNIFYLANKLDTTDDQTFMKANMLPGDARISAGQLFMNIDNFNFATTPNVTGSKGSNAALTSLIAALVELGLITDGTS